MEANVQSPEGGLRLALSNGFVATLDVAGLKAVVRPLLDGFVEELERRFGDGWIDEFRRITGLSAIRTAVAATREDVKYVARSLAPSAGAVREPCNLRGAKRMQWEWFCQRRREASREPVRRSALLALEAVAEAGGYTKSDVAAFVSYANRHRSWWEGDGDGL